MSSMNALSSGIDVNAMVSALMDLEKIPLGRLEKSKTVYDSQLSNYTHLTNLLTKFTDSIANIETMLSTHSYKANSSNEQVLSAALSGNVFSAGVYTVDITQLATAHQLASTVFPAKDNALNIAGTLNIATGSDNFSLTINSDDTLEKIRDHINTSFNNKGVNASILATTAVDGSAEFRLVLTSKETGLTQQMTLSGDSLILASLDITNTLSTANDASFTIDGLNVVRSSNTISDLLDGITLTLNAQSSATLTLSPDNINQADNIKKGLMSVVDAYNALIDLIDRNESTTSTRDSTYGSIKLRLRNTMEQSLGEGSIQTWLDMGIKTASSTKLTNDNGVEYFTTGKLKVDDALCSAAINEHYQSIGDFFTTTDGFISTMRTTIDNVRKEGGIISNRESNIKHQEKVLDHKIDREESRLETQKENLTKQYAALNTYIQHYQQISNFLEQQLDALKIFRTK